MDKRYKFTPEEKLEIVLSIMRNPKKQRELLGKYGMGQATYYKWRSRFLQGGMAALKDQKSGIKPQPRESIIEQEMKAKLAAYEKRINELATELEIVKKNENWTPEE